MDRKDPPGVEHTWVVVKIMVPQFSRLWAPLASHHVTSPSQGFNIILGIFPIPYLGARAQKRRRGSYRIWVRVCG